jgi:ecotropic viral integration site 5 protein
MMMTVRAASKDLDLENTYLKLLKDTSIHEKAITRDLGRYGFSKCCHNASQAYHVCRTFPHHDFFTDGQGIGQENLFNVLKAYSLYVANY